MIEPSHYFSLGLSVDNVIFGFDQGEIKVLLIVRGKAPYKDFLALPGNMVRPDETLSNASIRVLKELTGLENVYLEQVGAFGDVDRHPGGRVVTVAYYSLVNTKRHKLKPALFAERAAWHALSEIQELAFDHKKILDSAVDGLRKSIRIRPIGFELLNSKFSLTELQQLYEAILDMELDKRNFRKKILSMDVLVDLDEYQSGVAHRPAKLYEFDYDRYTKFLKEGFSFAI